MSLMRINYVRNEIKKLSIVIENLIKNYDRDYKKFDSEYKSVKNVLKQKIMDAEKKSDWETHTDLIQEETTYLKYIENIKNLAQFQNELILVKHVALIESMIIVLFEHLIYLTKNKKFRKEFFEDIVNFSDIHIAIKKIASLTENKIKIKNFSFWKYYETMRTIRHFIVHGEPLFEISYRRLNEFNEKLNLIKPDSEIEEDQDYQKFSPIRLYPTYDIKSKWFCHLSDDITQLLMLNKMSLDFVEDVRNSYLIYCEINNISDSELYAKSRF